jgi:hypothetical protein
LQNIGKLQTAVFTAVVIGFFSGFLLSQVSASEVEKSKCERVEEGVRNASNVTGAVACFPPGVIDVELDDVVENNTDVECVCRRSFEGSVQYWSFNRVDQSVSLN